MSAVDITKMGFAYEKNVFLQAEIPSYIDNTTLIADALLLSDSGHPLAIVLCGYDLKSNPNELHTVAEIYSNSAKKRYGMRPIVVFISEGKAKVINGVLGSMQDEIKPLGAPIFEELVAIHNIQEEEFYTRLMKDKMKMVQFVQHKLDHAEMNKELLEVLEEAKKVGYVKYYNEHYGSEDEMKSLKNQAVLMLALGQDNYKKHLQGQGVFIREKLDKRAAETFAISVDRRNWTEGGGGSPEMRLLAWAMKYLGWDTKQVKKDLQIPCYLDDTVDLMADYVFFDVNDKPLAVFVNDELHLGKDKEFVLAEFYARSCKAKYGLQPMVVVFSNKGAYLKPGALTGGFEKTGTVIHHERLSVETTICHVVEDFAWGALLSHLNELKAITDSKKRAKRQLEIIEQSTKNLGDSLTDPAFLAEQYVRVTSSTELKEEQFWKEILGSEYNDFRDKELKRIRVFMADKRMRYLQLNGTDEEK